MRFHTAFLLLLFLQCAAAESRIGVPALGYAYDSSVRGIRAIRGVPGAALVSEALDIGFDAADAMIAPSQDYALVISAGSREVRIIRWQAEVTSVQIIPDAMEAPDRILFSQSGSAAALYDDKSGRLQILTGLPNLPAVREAGVNPAAQTIAVANDGTIALAATDGVRIIEPNLESFSLLFPASIAALAFDPSSYTLLAVTSSGSLYLARDFRRAADIRNVYAGDNRTEAPVAVQFSPDASTAFVANTSGVLASINLNTGEAVSLYCQCTPTVLQPFGRTGLFRLTDISDKPVLLFDSTPNPSRFWFVPAVNQRSAK